MAVSLEGILRFSGQLVHLPTFPLFCAYIVFVWLSPLWKRYTKPLEFRTVLIVFNFGLSLVSLYTLTGFVYGLWESGDMFGRETTPILQRMFLMYFVCKVVELLDTVFMVLRHKTRQLSFLHVFHHSSMLLLIDFTRIFAPWPAIVPFLTLNSFVHVVLYFYYGLSALYPDDPPKWKKQMTQVQILQFFVLFVHGLYGYLYYEFCVYGLLYGIAMTSLFLNFYYKAYAKERTLKKTVHNGKTD